MHAPKNALFAIAAIAIVATCGSALATQAVPTNFQTGAGTDIGNGILEFNLTWGSSTGNLQDLSNCTFGEYVTYPDTDNPYLWPDPAWLNTATDNPTITTAPLSAGHATDDHFTGDFDHYIVGEVEFAATQRYWWSCSSGGGVGTIGSGGNLATNITIDRDVKQVKPDFQPCARYTVKKLGYKATFIPSEITTCDPQLPKDASERIAYRARRLPAANVLSSGVWKITAWPASSSYSVGEPVFVDLQVTNSSSEPATLDLGGDGKANLRVTIMEPGGLSRRVRLSSAGLTESGKHMIAAHSSYTERLVLNEWNAFREAGDYYATIALIPPGTASDAAPAADLHVNVGPRNEAKLGAVARSLADQAIDDHDAGDRSKAAAALSCMADPIAVPEIARVLASSDAGLPLIGTLARIGGPSALAALQAAQDNPQWWIREAAVRALRGLRNAKPQAPSRVAD